MSLRRNGSSGGTREQRISISFELEVVNEDDQWNAVRSTVGSAWRTRATFLVRRGGTPVRQAGGGCGVHAGRHTEQQDKDAWLRTLLESGVHTEGKTRLLRCRGNDSVGWSGEFPLQLVLVLSCGHVV